MSDAELEALEDVTSSFVARLCEEERLRELERLREGLVGMEATGGTTRHLKRAQKGPRAPHSVSQAVEDEMLRELEAKPGRQKPVVQI